MHAYHPAATRGVEGLVPATTPYMHTGTPDPTVPSDCYPLELVQFWRGEYKRGLPLPLHWALFVRTRDVLPRRLRSTHPSYRTPTGHFYELVDAARTLNDVTFMPERVPDWRGTRVVGHIRPDGLPRFEDALRGVNVQRHRDAWRSQMWACAVLRALSRAPGVVVERVTLRGLQTDMTRLLDAWENEDGRWGDDHTAI